MDSEFKPYVKAHLKKHDAIARSSKLYIKNTHKKDAQEVILKQPKPQKETEPNWWGGDIKKKKFYHD